MTPTTRDRAGTIADAVRNTRRALDEAGIAEADIESRRLVEAVTGHTASTLFLHADDRLDAAQSETLASLVDQRCAGVPVARILGEREFYGLPLKLVSETLDPRPDTETLVDAVLGALPAPEASRALRILDLGCGSGAIGLALVAQRPDVQCWAVDRSEASARCALNNSKQLGLADRYAASVSDWGAAIEALFDVVVSNPPYIRRGDIANLPEAVRDHDPELALDGGRDGLDAYRTILGDVSRLLKRGGFVAFETGWDQHQALREISAAQGFEVSAARQDMAGRDRVLILRLSAFSDPVSAPRSDSVPASGSA
jgi:release factor glutamine methyltransferase